MSESIGQRLGSELIACPGVTAVMLGGSAATGAADTHSDVDLGLYYDPARAIDLDVLRQIVSAVDDRGTGAPVTEPGDWGPWVDGGAWLIVEGRRVDLIYRNLERVEAALRDCRSGKTSTHFQVGHPAGFTSQIYAGEIDTGLPLQDPEERVADLKRLARPFPAALKRAGFEALREADFLLDAAYVAGMGFRAAACMAQALYSRNERYWDNEKGAVRRAGAFPVSPPGFAERVTSVFGRLGRDEGELNASLDALVALVVEVRSCLEA